MSSRYVRTQLPRRPAPDNNNKRSRSRSRSRSPPRKSARRTSPPAATADRRKQERYARDQTRLNALQENETMREWVNQEDTFVLKQAKKKAEIRVKEGRAKPIDWLAVNLRVIDKERTTDPLDDEIADEDLDVVDPEAVLDGLAAKELEELEADIDVYVGLETVRSNREYWATMKVICRDRREKSSAAAGTGAGAAVDGERAVSSVAGDVDRLFGSKRLEELEALERQIVGKLNSDEILDVDYWDELLRSVRVWKAKAGLKKMYRDVITNRLDILVKQQKEEARTVRAKLEAILGGAKDTAADENTPEEEAAALALQQRSYPAARTVPYNRAMDPEPMLRLRHDEKALESCSEREFLDSLTEERRKVLKMGYVPLKARAQYKQPFKKRLFWQKRSGSAGGAVAAATAAAASAARPTASSSSASSSSAPPTSRFAAVFDNDDFSQATKALYEREVARGVGDNEEIFTGEEEVTTSGPKPAWASKYRPRKPRYFNRVQMGYEWNKYNQTHYDHDNPPPRVVQGYKFNIFYPDLIDKSKAPTYRIEREGGRKRGQSFAPAGEEDTCVIRFIAGPPYEDLAFRIVDKEWDYSAKRERGFRSSFDKGILQLHFQLKKIYYRK
ncbi:mid region of cactin-domain-containing protein [Morchella snyderi]|nr:mid region of cactin-domain-containing protein [Morchella snyderi]